MRLQTSVNPNKNIICWSHRKEWNSTSISVGSKVSDRNLDTRKACLCVESLLEYLGGRQLTTHEMRETWVTTVTTIRETREEWTLFQSTILKVSPFHQTEKWDRIII